jgi:hypothetical protein
MNSESHRAKKIAACGIGIADGFVRDEAKMKELWTPWIKPWFPNGLEDHEAALMRVPMDSEVRDTSFGAVKQLYRPVNTRAPLEATDRGQG